MPGMRPLTVAAGKTLEHFGAAEGGGRNEHGAVNGVMKKAEDENPACNTRERPYPEAVELCSDERCKVLLAALISSFNVSKSIRHQGF